MVESEPKASLARHTMIRTATSFILLLLTAPVGTEMVDVRNRGRVDLATFGCRDINRSTIVQRVCYDSARRVMIIGIKGGYDQYCGLPAETFASFMTAPSMGQFFNRHIRRSQQGGRYDCGIPARSR